MRGRERPPGFILLAVAPLALALVTGQARSEEATGASAPPTTTTTTTTGTVGCAAIKQAAANGVNARISADTVTITAPKSVTEFSCFDDFFHGVGLDVVTNLLNPTNLLRSVEGKICQAVRNEWTNATSGIQCGLTITGFDFGIGGLGGGISCPKLAFGAGGPPLANVNIGVSDHTSLYINGRGMAPTGFSVSDHTGAF